MYVTIEVTRTDDNIFITHCPEFDVHARGRTQRQAVRSIKKKIASYIRLSASFTDAQQDIDYTIHYYSGRFPQMH